MQPGGGKIVYPMGKWSVEPWQGGRERQAWAEGHGWPPTGSTLLPAVVGNTKRKRVGWEALAPLCRGRTTDLKRLLCLMNCSL